jgi:hypothetical protein
LQDVWWVGRLKLRYVGVLAAYDHFLLFTAGSVFVLLDGWTMRYVVWILLRD